jgi:hypothetical protein
VGKCRFIGGKMSFYWWENVVLLALKLANSKALAMSKTLKL